MLQRVKRYWKMRRRVDRAESQPGKGQSLVEMAVITPLLLLMLVGVFEVGYAIRSSIVLTNADREGTRFAARGTYLDFSETDPAGVGYGTVLSHTLDSVAQQLPFDVTSAEPNGTVIISHFLVDSSKPCDLDESDPTDTCIDYCDSPPCDCSAPNKREPDYVWDDLELHPGMYGYFSALYGINRESRLDYDEVVAQLKEGNDVVNCSLNAKDSAVPWSVNSVVVVEMFYDQPQLLGVPLISNQFTDPVTLYAQTMMRIIPGGRGEIPASQGQGCELIPIAVHIDTLSPLSPGMSTGNIRNGTGSGNFGWLRWTDDSDLITSNPNSEQYLAEEIKNPRLALHDYKDPNDSDCDDEPFDDCDTVLDADYDWVRGLTGNINSNGVARTQLEDRIGDTFVVPVWDVTTGHGSGVKYHIVRFAWITLGGYDLTGNPKQIWGTFQGWADDICPGNGE